MSGLFWKLNRLRAMGAGEVLYRARHALQAQWERRGVGLAKSVEPGGDFGRTWLGELPRGFDVELYRAAADRVLAGRFDVFALRGVELGFPPRWNRDPKTGTDAPLVFGKTLNYRDESVVGDIKYLWEPNRHLELVTLAQAWHLSGEARYAEGCRALLDSWFVQCPYPLGVNWTSSLEHAVRLVNWSVAWGVLVGLSPQGGEGVFAGADGLAFRRRWLDSIYQHLHFISGHFSKYSSANNHLFGEYMGLFIGCVTWPLWQECGRWQAVAQRGLEAEALKQTSPDGVNREQAFWYHHEVADMMLLCGLFGRANGVAFSGEYWRRLEAMLEFVTSVMDVGGNVPAIGDADDAVMVRWMPSIRSGHLHDAEGGAPLDSRLRGNDEFNVYRSLLVTGAVLFNRPDFKAKAGGFEDKSRWLLGDAAERAFDALPMADVRLPVRCDFPDGGYYVLGGEFETPREVRIVADAGPLGYLSIAAHGHADALAFTLSAGGRALLIDPGTFSYHTQKKWRDYFKGTSAHNTVRVDGVDQSVSGGNFLWVKHARARCERWAPGVERDVFVGAHDGYQRLKDAVTHRRELVYEKAARMLTVTDTLECKQPHAAEVFWHFAEACEVSVVGRVVVVRNMDVVLTLAMPGDEWLPEVVSGREEPPLGWVSRKFDEKLPTVSVVWRGKIRGRSSFSTVFVLETL